MRLTKKQSVLIIFTIICTALLVYLLCFLADNLSTTIDYLSVISDEPNHPHINQFKKNMYFIIGFIVAISLYYSLYLWLAISVFVQEIKRHHLRPESTDK